MSRTAHAVATELNRTEQQATAPKPRSLARACALVVFGSVCFGGGYLTKSYMWPASEGQPTLENITRKLDHLTRSVEGRLDTLSRAIFDRPAVPTSVDTTSVPLPNPPEPRVPIVPVAKLLEEADRLRTAGNLREAEILLTRAVQTDRDEVSAWRALAAVQRDMSRASLAAGNFQNAAQEADRGRTSVNGIKGLSIEPTQTFEPRIVTEEENAISEVIAQVRAAVDAECQRCIQAAWKSKQAGTTPWYWKNNRWWTVDGLKHLRKVIELGPWASQETRMSANEAFSALKKMVSPEERNDLLAQAGFDPASRDSLRKWGLE